MVIVITGPTATGKSDLGIFLAHKLNGEIINADSTQIYKGLDIATNKIKDTEGIKHYLFDEKDLREDYTVFDYQKDARAAIDDILSRGKIPILVGGTGLYINAALYDYKFEDKANDEYEGVSNDELYKMLLEVDSNTSIHLNNRVRVISALNYYKANGKPYSEKEKDFKLLYDTIFIGELSLDGKINKVNGILPICIEAKKLGIKRIILPKDNAEEAAIVKEVKVIGVQNLSEVVDYLNENKYIIPTKSNMGDFSDRKYQYDVDFSEVKGQENVKRALEIATARWT